MKHQIQVDNSIIDESKQSKEGPTSCLNDSLFDGVAFDVSGGAKEVVLSSHKDGIVWDLIPDARQSMYPHQRVGFKFIWTNLAGTIDLEKLKNANPNGARGCIISHDPKTGKTRRSISQFEKLGTIRKVKEHVDAINKVDRWGESKADVKTGKQKRHIKKKMEDPENRIMAKFLRDISDFLVLDKGQTPRNHNSLIWKALFLVELVLLCDAMNEKVLVVSQYLDPLCLVRDQLKSILDWYDGNEVLNIFVLLEKYGLDINPLGASFSCKQNFRSFGGIVSGKVGLAKHSVL
ncbi:hypothetical protein RIF29_30127 [Crotalaria pallida]|uniref:Uncharacterized protein n=1 Tax=Crotalaria pallida TaxID=3830 RepID=A0AAN9HWH6_CROPI